ncbi:protein SWEETIE isoform X2 [Phoenix dactylifera]|uniref:Protein SWEETIE isoform X2 n=1 Tax=Phoenix dactylifera TaxID=42345 RepID=A0A8B9AQ11_PHODC|nr:protein SWEETIE isoform X2 [Phoenix dactylifera]
MARREIDAIPLSRFGVLVAQLESIVASAPQQPPDVLLCFDLLSELITAIEDEPKESIQQWQRKCEDALFSLLIFGARRPVRRLASSAMGRVIARGDGISIYSRASSLQGWLADGKRSEPLSCAGAAQCLGELYHLFGRRITSGLVETTSIAAKLMKFHEDFVRQDAMQMLENALEGSGGSGASTAYSEAFRIIMRVGVNDKSLIVRLAAARCLKTFASIGGPGLGITELENSIIHCVKALEDPVQSVRDAFAEALGALLALAMNPEAQIKQRGKNHPVPVKKLDDGLQKHLISPFIRASGVRAKEQRIGLALSWVSFLQVIRVKYHLPDSELQNFALLSMDMLQGDASLDAQALACVLYVLRVGVTDQMTEPTQRSFLVFLGRKLESADCSPAMRVAALRILSYLLTTLGEVPVEFKDVLDNTVVAALSHSSLHVRIEAALTLRALAEVDPTCVGGLISYGVTTLHALRESARFEKGMHLNAELDSLHGQAAVLAALVSISPKLLLGYPARLPKSVFEVSKKMLAEYSRNPLAATVEKEAGWLLLASLIASMPKEELEDQVFDILLLWAGPFPGNPESYIGRIQDFPSELRVLSAATEALIAFVRSFESPTVASTNVLLQPVLAYLRVALSYISSFSAKLSPNIKPALDLFTIRTLMAYRSVSDPVAYKSEHPQIIHICTSPFRYLGDWLLISLLNFDPSGFEESSCLRLLLDKRDACLGPWKPGRDSFEDELRAFNGGKDGLMPCVWDEVCSFPQPEPISKMLVNQMLLCFGTIFASQDNGGKLKLLNKIDHCLKTGKKQSWRVASFTNACVGLLAGLKAMLASHPQTLAAEIFSTIQSIFLGILADGEICSTQRRASSEGLGLLARLGSDIFTARMTRSLLGELVAATDPNYIGSIALSLGCIHRSAGGMALSALVPSTVSSLSSLAKSPNASLQLWALHALLLTIEAAGLSYVSQVQATLFLAIDILLSEENGLVDLRQEIGRLINAIVAVLGPELAPGSTFFSRCKAVIAEISSCQEISTLLESVRFTQQLVLFAPQAVSVHSHVQSLLPTLSSRQPSLRSLAVSTLHHLIEKDPLAMIDENIEENLFSMLDEETDSEIGSLVRATITRLFYASCPLCPSRWLAIFRKLVLATSTGSNAAESNLSSGNENSNGTLERDVNLHYGDDDEDMIAGSKGEQMQGSVSASRADTKRGKHLRYRTRIFAAECLSCLPTAVGNNPAHFDISLARSQPAKGRSSLGDWLVLHLQELVALSYQISTGQFEGMQPIGVRLLSIIMDKFGRTPDPELPGHLLLEQYQAQLVSAVRSAISTSSGPLLLEAGLQLATKILTSSIVSGDRVALNRMFSLISHQLNDIKDLYYPSFAEWVACKIKVRLLAAHASIKCYVYQFWREQKGIPDEYLQLIPLFSTSSNILGEYWISILKDYSYVCFGLHPKVNYKPFLDGIQSLLVSSKVKECLHEAWPLILQAAALDAVPMKFELDKASQHDEDLPRTPFISGHSMVRLKLNEFQFLWGLSLLVLFQGQQLVSGNQGKMLLVHVEKKHSGDSMPQGAHYLSSFEIPLLVFQSLSKEVFFSQEFLSLDLCKELLQVLISADYTSASCNGLVIYLLSQIVKFCPDNYFHMDDFATAATELYFKCLMVTFQSDRAFLQDHSDSNELLSELFNAAETIAYRINHKKRWNLIMALISISREWFRLASTNLLLSKAISFLQNLVPFMKRCFIDEAELHIDDYDNLMTVLGAWASMLAFLSQDCIKRICIMESKISDSSKLLAKILVFCLEEVVALARLVHQSHHLREYKANNHMLLFSVFKLCTKCVRDTFYVTNIQIQTLGLHVVKNIAQKELAEGSQMKSHSFLLFFIGELFRDVFLLIQHTLKEHKSRESVAITDECLRLLFLFHTLARGSECQKAVMMLLLEALFMVFYLSSGSLSQETNEVNTVTRSMVSHLVQIPSAVIQIKDAILSMPVTRRQQIQDMLRTSVTQYQMGTQGKLNVQPESDAREVHQVQASDFIVAPADKHDIKEEEEEDDDDDWDAFQSLPANNVSASPTDSHVDWREPEAASVDDSSPAESDHSKNCCHHHDLSHQNVFEEVTPEQGPATGTGEEMTSLVRNELVEPSDSQYSQNEGVIEDSGGIKVQELSKQSINEGGDKMMGNDVDDTIRSAIQLVEDDELIKENEDQRLHHKGGNELKSTGNEDSTQEHSVDGLSAPKDNAKEDNERECDGQQHLHHERGSESESIVNEDGAQQHCVNVIAATENNEQECEAQHLLHQGGGELRSRSDEVCYGHSDDVPSAPNNKENETGGLHPYHEDDNESKGNEDGPKEHSVHAGGE